MEIELLEKRIAELEKQNAWLMGNTAMLGLALHAVMVNHPGREDVASAVREAHEEFVSRALPRPFPEDFLDGIEAAYRRMLKPER